MNIYEYLHYISNISRPGFSGHNVDGGLPLPDVACLSRDQDTAALDLGLSKELDALLQNFLSVETLTEFKLWKFYIPGHPLQYIYLLSILHLPAEKI